MQIIDKQCDVDITTFIYTYQFKENDPPVNQFLPYFTDITPTTTGNKLLSYLQPFADVLRSTDTEEPEEPVPDPNDKKAAAKPKEVPVQIFIEKQPIISAEQRYIDTLNAENIAIRHWAMLLLLNAIFDIENVHSMEMSIQDVFYILEIAQRCLYSVSFSQNAKLYQKQFRTTLSFLAFLSKCSEIDLENKKLTCNEQVLRWEKSKTQGDEETSEITQNFPSALLDNYFYALFLATNAWPKVLEISGLLQPLGGAAPSGGKGGKSEIPAPASGAADFLKSLFAKRQLAAFVYNNLLIICTSLGDQANLHSGSISRLKYAPAAKGLVTMAKDVATFISKTTTTLKSVCNELLDAEGTQISSGLPKELQIVLLFEKELTDAPKAFQIKEAAVKQVKEASHKCFDVAFLLFSALKCYSLVCLNSLQLPVVPLDPKTGKPDPAKADPTADLLNINLERSTKDLFKVFSTQRRVVPYRYHPVYIDNYGIIQLFREYRQENPLQQQIFTVQELIQLLTQQMQFYDSELRPILGNLEAFSADVKKGQFSLLHVAGFILKVIQAINLLTGSAQGGDKKGGVAAPPGPVSYVESVAGSGNAAGFQMPGIDKRLADSMNVNTMGLLQLMKTCM